MDKKWKITVSTITVLALIVLAFFIYKGSDHDEKATENDEKDLEKVEDIQEQPKDESSEATLVSIDKFEPTTVPPGSSGVYELSYTLNNSERFIVDASIEVENMSEEEWDKIGFYVVPNAFTEENKPEEMGPNSLPLEMGNILLNGKEATYTLENNNLFVLLEEKLTPGEKARVEISYEMKVPMGGIRLREELNGYYLVYSYPMLATYQDGWNMEFFNPNGESYHTGYGEFTVHYQLPKDYYVVTSAVDGEAKPTTSGTVTGENIKDFYIAYLDPEHWVSKSIQANNNVTLRSFVGANFEDRLDESLTYMKDAFTYFNDNVGSYISEELDMIANNGGMEYPFVVEVYEPNVPKESFENVIAHEVAHQWFYHMISNDPYKEAWLDEGLTEFVVSLYLYDKYQDENLATYRMNAFTNGVHPFPVNQSIEALAMDYGVGAYGFPPYKLWTFFTTESSLDDATEFLAVYFDTYKLSQVTSEEFVNFFESYQGEHYHEFFEEWLDLDWTNVH